MKLQKRKIWDYDKLTDDSGAVWKVHKAEICEGQTCAIHNPSDHKMNAAKMVLRSDPFKYAMPERFCEHGIGHPDHDSVTWYAQQGTHGMGVHGCDGCCISDPDDNPYGLTMEDIH